MALVEAAGGTQLTVINTEHTLATLTAGKTYVLVVDLTPMANGDVVELRIKTKARSGGTSVEAYEVTYANAQTTPQTYSVPVPANVEFLATLKQTLGTVRTFTYAVLSID